MSSSPPPKLEPEDRFLKPTLPLRVQVNAVASSSTSTAIASSSQSVWQPSQDVDEDTGVAMYRRQEVPASQYLASQPTQIADIVHEIPESTVFGCMRGRGTSLDVDLCHDRSSYLFGISDECDVIIPHSHWRLTIKKEKEPWFKLHISHSKKSTDTIVHIEAVREKGVFVQSKPLFPGSRRHLRVGDTVAGSQDEGNELFYYTYRYTNSEEPQVIYGEHASYNLEDYLDSGMYSQVYRALSNTGEECACKLISLLSREMNDEEKENIPHEINLLKSMDHKNIVRFIDVAEAPYKFYIFTEMIHGTTLQKYTAGNNDYHSELEARHIFEQICQAVNYLHQQGIVHRDIKSENIMLTEDKRIKLIDFGLARTISSKEVLTNRCGTRAYMAPETDQSDDSNAYGKAVDVWSLGVLLFRMLSGIYPFTFDDEHHVNGDASQQSSMAITDQRNVERIEKDGPSSQSRTPYDRDWRPFLDRQKVKRSPDVRLLLEGMLSKDPSKRLTIQSVLRSDWMRMIDEELAKFDKQVPNYGEFSGAGPSTATNTDEEPWGELNIVPGSINMAPRKIILTKEKYWIGRHSQADVRVGPHRGLSLMHCMIYKKQDEFPEDMHLPADERRKKEVIMVADGSHNGTYVNLLKIGHGMATQVVHGDVLGLVVPQGRDPENLQGNWFNESLKYTVTLKTKLPETFNPAKRRYESCDEVPENNKTRVMETRSRGPKWGDLINVGDPTNRYDLAGSLITVGRDRLATILVEGHKFVSRAHCVIEWDGMYPYVESTAPKNPTWVAGQRVEGRVQLRDNDVITLAQQKGDSEYLAFRITFERPRRE
ncbi:CAMK protein kinase [Podila verticillata NRRL 6337]|nr:CAMK protein kinase [Podila verticillata NRRL 6337]